MNEEFEENNQEDVVVDPVRLVKKVRKSRKVRSGRRKQSVFRKTFRFFMTLFLFLALIYISKMPQWYLPKDVFEKPTPAIIITNNNIVKSDRIMATLKKHKAPKSPIYMLRTADLEKDIKTLKPIKEVYIRRYAFPARLHILVKERVPVIVIASDEKGALAGAFAEDGVFFGHEYMPINPKIKTIKVLAKYGGETSYTKWTLAKVNEIQKIVQAVETASKESVEYIDMRNPNDVYVKIKTAKIRIGKIDGTLFDRIQRIPSILPQVKLISSKVLYLDISWEKVNYLKLK